MTSVPFSSFPSLFPSVNPNLPLAGVQTLDEIQADSMAQTFFAMVMLAVSASVALLLGVVGICGVMAWSAARPDARDPHPHGAGRADRDVRRLFLRHELLLTSARIAIGMAASLVVTRVLPALLFGVGPMDLVTFAAVSVGLAAVALLATWLPPAARPASTRMLHCERT